MNHKFLNKEKVNQLEEPMFLGSNLGIARYDNNKYDVFNKLTDLQLSFFWRPEEVDVSQDAIDFKSKLSFPEQHIFVSNLKRQTLLDTQQGRAPATVLMPITSIPEYEIWLANWAFNETLHSKSYTYIIKNCFTEPDKIFDSIMDIKEIVECAEQITESADDLYEYVSLYNVFGFGNFTVNKDGKEIKYNINLEEFQEKIIKYFISVNVLEGVRFYVSFACSWAFAERKLMEGNAKIIKLICRDENNHLVSTQKVLQLLKNNEGMGHIFEKLKQYIYDQYIKAVNDEKKWAEFLFKDGSMLGLNKKILSQFVEYIANTRLDSIGLDKIFEQKTNPLPWVNKWIGNNEESKQVQVAPQETEKSEYLVGSVEQDFDLNKLKETIVLY